VKALLTAVSSNVVLVQEQSLLLAVRACYHIYLVSKNAVNKNTAKASLKQLLAVVFNRMEAAAVAAAAAAASAPAAAAGAPPAKPAVAVVTPAVVDTTAAASTAAAAVVPEVVPVVAPAAAAVEDAAGSGTGAGGEAGSVAASGAGSAAGGAGFGEYMYPEVSAALGFILATAAPAVVAPAPPAAAAAVPAPVAAAAPTPPAATPTAPAASATASVAPAAPAAAAAAAAPGAFPAASSSPDAQDLSGFPSPRHRDAFLLFRALCRLSMKGGEESPLLPPGATHLPGAAAAAASGGGGGMLSDEALQADPVALQSKLLSLDLLLGLLDNSGPAFQSQPRCIGAIKQYLCMGLLKNILSTIPAVSSLSLKVFLSLMRHFKQHIAPEIEVFISTIFLRTLSSPLSSYEQKAGMLAAFRSIAADAGGLLEIFLNYDCAEGRQDLFEASVKVLASITQGRTSEEFNASQSTAAEHLAIRHAAMAALGAVMDSCAILADQAALQTQAQEQQLLRGAAASMPSAEAIAAADAPDVQDDSSSVAATKLEPPGTPGGTAAAAAAAASAQSTASSALARQYDEQRRRRVLLEKASIKFM
jgi:brefeldin A-inhibited guanine nucleotide-exchange protein